MIRLQLLGSIDLRDERGGELRSVLAQPKRLALLAYLAAASPPGAQRRDTLLGLFWPELDDEHARNALSKAVHFLRRSLGEDAIVSRSSEELALDSTVVWTDVRAFGAALDEGRPDEALELYQGDLLPSFFVQEAAGFEEWLERERARLRSQAAGAARLLAERHEAGRHLTLAAASARRAVELSNGDERQLRRLIELLDRLGDRAGALRAYEDFARRLASDLEVDPDPETVALIERVRAAPLKPVAPPQESVASIPSQSTIARLSKAVASRYKIERQLGAGAMAVVALAHDLRHHRRVAIKILRPELSSLMGPERFLREIDIAASLMHPHILPLHDSGEADGLLYYVMPYVEGESLRGRLDRERQLPVADALQIAREVADALGYAHHRGFIHRDIKPENILLGGGHALVADFGIAQAIDSVAAEQRSTKGLGTGTPAYMSPEQVTGEWPVDERTDIYALGCVLYEMLSGGPPFSGITPEEIIAERLKRSPLRLSLLRKEIAPELEWALARALARNPADRFPRVSELGSALTAKQPAQLAVKFAGPRLKRWVTVGIPAAVLATVLALLAGNKVDSDARTAKGAATTSSVAVLPIENLSGDSAKAFLADGLTADLIDELFRIEGLRVPGSATVARYRGLRPQPGQVARELNVEAVITGNVREVAGRPRVALQLVNAADGFVRWSGIYDENDISAGADIAGVLAESLRYQLRPQGRADINRTGTRDAEAYRLYLQGRHLLRQVGRTSVRQGLQALERAIARDSSFADAWAALPLGYGLLFQLGGLTETENQVLQRRAVERAIELDSLNGEAYGARAHLRAMHEWDYTGADRDYRRAIELTPGSAYNRMVYSQFLNLVALDDSAIVVMRQAMDLEPTEAWYIANYSFRLAAAGQLDDAFAEARRALQHDSTQWVAYHALAWVHWRRGHYLKALHEAERGLQVFGDSVTFLLGRVGQYAGLAGQRSKAEAILAKLERSRPPDLMWAGLIRLGLGDRSGALEALELAADNRHGWLGAWLVGGEFEALRGDPRYEALVKRVGVTEFRNRRFPGNPPASRPR